jgi:hypothetical protein
VLWGLAGKPVDDETLEAVAKLREALRGELGEQAVRALDQPRDQRAARQSRCAARYPLMPTPDRRRPSRGRPASLMFR